MVYLQVIPEQPTQDGVSRKFEEGRYHEFLSGTLDDGRNRRRQNDTPPSLGDGFVTVAVVVAVVAVVTDSFSTLPSVALACGWMLGGVFTQPSKRMGNTWA